MALFEETERVKIRFVRAYERLFQMGYITEADLEEIIDVIDRLDEYSQEELERILGRFKKITLA